MLINTEKGVKRLTKNQLYVLRSLAKELFKIDEVCDYLMERKILDDLGSVCCKLEKMWVVVHNDINRDKDVEEIREREK